MIKYRAIEYAKSLGMSVKELSDALGVSVSTFKGPAMRSELSTPVVAVMLGIFPDLDPDWLLLGKGEMKRSDAPQATETTLFAVSAMKDTIESQKTLIASLEAEIRRNKEEIMFYREKLKNSIG